MLISVIIPVYNTSPYLDRCLKSLISQTFSDFEIIAINDGSTDNSIEILYEYSKEYSNIIVIDKINEGVSQTRQVGIDIAKGAYTIHVDSDDWVEPDFLEKLAAEAVLNQCDIVICDCVLQKETGMKLFPQGPIENKSSYIKGLLESKFLGSLCNKLIRNNLYKEKDIRFPKHFNLCEDLYVILSLLSYDVKIAHVNAPLYNYYTREGSITNLVDCVYHNDFANFLNEIYKNQYLRTKFKLEILRRVLGTRLSMIKDGCYESAPRIKFLQKSNQLIWLHSSIPIKLKSLMAAAYIRPFRTIIKKVIRFKHYHEQN